MAKKTADCKLILQVCSTGDAAVAQYQGEQRAQAKPTLDAMSKIVTPLWQDKHTSVLPEGGPNGAVPLVTSALYPVTAANAKMLLSGNSLPADGPALNSGGPNLRSLVADQMSNQQFLLCKYDRDANATMTFAFWYQSAPTNIDDLMSLDVGRDFIYVGASTFSRCPATYGEASAARRAAVIYTGSAKFADIRKAYRASKDAQGAAAPGQTVESLRIAAQAQQSASPSGSTLSAAAISAQPSARTVSAQAAPTANAVPPQQQAEDPHQRQCAQMWKNVETARARARGLREMIGVKSMENSVRRQCREPK